MTTRYSEIIFWAIQYFTFCLFIIGLYFVLDKRLKVFRIQLSTHSHLNLYAQDALICLVLVLITGIRCNNGSDYYNYWVMYSEVTDWYSNIGDVLEEKFQNGYLLLCYVTKALGGGKYSIFWVVSVLIYFSTIRLFRRYSCSPVLSFACWVLFGYLAMSTNIIKQSLAMTCILWAFFCLERKRYVQFCCLSLLGCMFHISMVCVVFIMLFFRWLHPSITFYKIIMVVSIAMYILITPLLEQVSQFLPVHYAVYTQAYLDDSMNDIKLQIGGIVVAIFYIIILWDITKKNNATKSVSRINNHLLMISLLCIPFLIIGIKFYLCNRVAYSGLQFLTVLLPSYYSFTRQKHMSFISFKKYIMVLVFSVLFTILCAENNYYQYSTILNDKPMSVYDFSIRRQQ